jgi:hypothetical protein
MLVDGEGRNSTLYVAAGAGTNPGSYPIVGAVEVFTPNGQYITTDSVTILVVVTSPAIFGVSPLVFYSAIGVVAGAGASTTAGALFLVRRRRVSKKMGC